ncbi:hypothetical protein [Streptomyces sp. NBC_01235]|uniref:hypothetical protein n=1 Tax=Streptomyces sp. NBC_01235 TaxID=2903788 RepID=UPI002E0FB63B|nr:hypothetical protein OG289_27600 [Streptomyces sp. NBC_01235]
MARNRVRALTVGAALCAAAGCGGGGGDGEPAPTPSATATQAPSRPYKDGHLTFTLLFLRCGLNAVAGSHSEGQPEGRFCWARLRVDNQDPVFHTYVAKSQRLAGVPGRPGQPDTFAMAVRRQHDSVEIGGHDLIEVELWYDVPRDAKVSGLRVSGDRDPAGYMNTSPAPYAPGGVLIAMKPLMGW